MGPQEMVTTYRRNRDLGSLLMGYHERGKALYSGSVGTGWSIPLGRSIMAKLQRIGTDTSPFVPVPRPDAKDARWTEPQLVAEVEFTAWTCDGRVRHPSFKGLREDKPAKAVGRETPTGPSHAFAACASAEVGRDNDRCFLTFGPQDVARQTDRRR
jgi:bifunctional non-homologous end joining protein LigD